MGGSANPDGQPGARLRTCNTFWMSPAWPYVFTKIPKVTGEGVTPSSAMRFNVISVQERSSRPIEGRARSLNTGGHKAG